MTRKTGTVLFLLVSFIATPIIVYVLVFGVKLSTDHSRWAEFGSIIGGIYAPFIALFTLVLLRKQVVLQGQLYVHERDLAHVQQARVDIEFYSTQMAQVLSGFARPGKTLRAVLHESFEPENVAELDSQQLRRLAANIHAVTPPAFDIWAAVYPLLGGLMAGKTIMYDMALGSCTQKLIALLSFETCVALDNLHRTRCEGNAQVDYVFSPLLTKKIKSQS